MCARHTDTAPSFLGACAHCPKTLLRMHINCAAVGVRVPAAHLDLVWVHKLASPHNHVHDLLVGPLLTDPVKLGALQPRVVAQPLTAAQTGRQTDRQTNRQAGKQTDRQMDKQTDRRSESTVKSTGGTKRRRQGTQHVFRRRAAHCVRKAPRSAD